MQHVWELVPIPSVSLGSGCCLYPAPGLWQGVHQFFSPLSPSLPCSVVCTHHGECSLKLSSSPEHCGPETPAGGSPSASHPGPRCLVLWPLIWTTGSQRGRVPGPTDKDQCQKVCEPRPRGRTYQRPVQSFAQLGEMPQDPTAHSRKMLICLLCTHIGMCTCVNTCDRNRGREC